MSRRDRHAVLGAGALGLTVALRLAERGDSVVVFEREAAPGGLAAGFPIGDVYLEKFYHHLFRTDRDAIALIRLLGLEDRLEWRRPVTSVLRDGHEYRMDSAMGVLRFRPLPVLDRLRLGGAIAYLRLQPRYELMSRDTSAGWIRRWMGTKVYDSLWGPLLVSKFGHLSEEIAMPWFWARIHYRTASLGYLRGGFQLLYEMLAEKVKGLGSEVRLSTEVREIVPAGRRLLVVTDRGGEEFDTVVSTLPTPVTVRITPSLPESYRSRFGSVQAFGAMCLVLALNRMLTESYWLNINDPGFAFQPLVEHTNLMSPEQYGGRHIIYLGRYLPMNDELFATDKAGILETFLPGIRRVNPSFDESWITESWLFKAAYAQPIVTSDYVSRIPPHVTPIAGLFVANMFQVYPQDRGQNYSIRLANRLVRDVL